MRREPERSRLTCAGVVEARCGAARTAAEAPGGSRRLPIDDACRSERRTMPRCPAIREPDLAPSPAAAPGLL
jgi:hypothetical protein